MADMNRGQDQDRRQDEGLSGLAGRASDALSNATDTLKNANMDDATRMAREGGRYAYETAASHPVITAAIAAVGAYLLFGPSRQSSSADMYAQARDMARGMARDYADRARDRYDSYDVRSAIDYGRDAASQLSSQASREPLAAAVGLGLVAWVAASLLWPSRN